MSEKRKRDESKNKENKKKQINKEKKTENGGGKEIGEDMKRLDKLKQMFELEKNATKAAGMKKYMREKFEYYGIQAPGRKKILQKFLKEEGENIEDIKNFSIQLISEEKRELNYCGLELFGKYHKKIFIQEEQCEEILTFFLKIFF